MSNTGDIKKYLNFPNGSYITQDSLGNIAFYDSTGTKQLSVDKTSGQIIIYNGNLRHQGTGGFSVFNNINTVGGVGVPPIYAAGAQTLYTNVAPTTLSYTPPATAGVYRLTGYLNALTAGTMTFKVKITYKDAGGNAVTDIPGFYLQNSTAIVAGGNSANTAGRYTMLSYPFSIDNSATAITIQDNAGTYTAGTYYWTPVLEQLA